VVGDDEFTDITSALGIIAGALFVIASIGIAVNWLARKGAGRLGCCLAQPPQPPPPVGYVASMIDRRTLPRADSPSEALARDQRR
jgi:hypothetical protein